MTQNKRNITYSLSTKPDYFTKFMFYLYSGCLSIQHNRNKEKPERVLWNVSVRFATNSNIMLKHDTTTCEYLRILLLDHQY